MSTEDACQGWAYLCFLGFCCPAKISKIFIIGFTSIIVHTLAYSSLFFYDIDVVNYTCYILVLLFLIIYIYKAFYFKYVLNKINYIY